MEPAASSVSDLDSILRLIKEKCSGSHSSAFTMALNELVNDISRAFEHDPALLDTLIQVCADRPVPNRHALPVHIHSAKGTLRSLLGLLLPEPLRPRPIHNESFYSAWDNTWQTSMDSTDPTAKPSDLSGGNAPVVPEQTYAQQPPAAAAVPSPPTATSTTRLSRPMHSIRRCSRALAAYCIIRYAMAP